MSRLRELPMLSGTFIDDNKYHEDEIVREPQVDQLS